jgi:glycerophosphoryl diester phosphodiesterase
MNSSAQAPDALPPLRDSTLIFGHRGASIDAPENTLAAFHMAWSQGADGVEGDFHLTADNQVVCIHDTDTLRTGGKKLVVAQSTLSQLRELEYGSWLNPHFLGEPIPLLSDILEASPPDRWLVMELKTGPEIVDKVQEELEKKGVDRERLLIISFDQHTITRSKLLMPEIKAHWLTSFERSPQGDSWSPGAEEILRTLHRCGADGLGAQNRPAAMTPTLLGRLKAGGLREFHVWTVDQPSEAEFYRNMGAFAVTTNCPSNIRQKFTHSG